MSGGVYAILKRSLFSPWKFRPIDIGETHDFSERVTRQHQRFDKWCEAANGFARVYVAFYVMPRATRDQRRAIEKRLTDAYQPICSDLKQRIDAFGASEARQILPRRSRMALAFAKAKKIERFGL